MTPLALRPDLQPKRRPAAPEQALQIEVAKALDWLLPTRVLWSAFPAGGGGKVRGAFLKSMGLKPGWSDIVLIWQSAGVHNHPSLMMGCIELKAPKGRQSADQIAFERKAAAIGIPYAIARSLDEVIDQLHAWGTPMRGSIGMRNKSP